MGYPTDQDFEEAHRHMTPPGLRKKEATMNRINNDRVQECISRLNEVAEMAKSASPEQEAGLQAKAASWINALAAQGFGLLRTPNGYQAPRT